MMEYGHVEAEAFESTSGLVPPQAPDVERSVLGAMLIDKAAVSQVIEVLPEQDAFFVPKHQKIYEAICELFRRDEGIDIITVTQELRRRKVLDTVEEFYLIDLSREVTSSANIQHHARLLVQKSVLRQLIAVLRARVAEAFDPGIDVFDLLEQTEQAIFSISETQVRRRAKQFKSLTHNVITHWEALLNRSTEVTGVPSGFADLDRLTGGWQKSDLIILAARPSMGKCVDAETPILLADGRIESIAHICARRQAELLTLGPSGRFEVTTPSAFINNGQKPVFTVETALGRQVNTTQSHPFLTRQGWRELFRLDVGDEIAVPRRLPVFGSGSARPGALSCLAEALLNPQRALRPLPVGDTLVHPPRLRTLPSWVFTLRRANIAKLIDRILEAGTAVRLGSTTAARQFAHLLLRFGIVSRLAGRGESCRVHVEDPTWHRKLHADPDPAARHIMFDTITSITFAGERPVFDLTVEGTHNFVAADVCVHNTALALGCARNAAMHRDNPTPCAIFSLEMTSQQLVQRLLTAEAEVNAQRARTGRLQGHEFQKLVDAASRMSAAPIYIDDTPALGVLELRAKCRRMKAEHDIGLVILDYLQLMHGNNPKNREQEIAHISRSLKALAKELEVPVLALSQLNRSPETRSKIDKRPLLSDLRESGSIEQDADVVAFIYRPELYKIAEFDDGLPTEGRAEIIIGKHRNGPIGTIKLAFVSKFARFANQPLDGTPPPEYEEESPF
ncbi:MAG: replicative DNA helicase [Bacteroidota bacterium]|nr:replicative DNA helicase [Bacteroidota bacterium]MDE2956340.1 replicative DNA helicase [Bacteroidota bacterium]